MSPEDLMDDEEVTMGDLVDFIHETVAGYDVIHEDINYSHNDEEAVFDIINVHVPNLMSACSAAVVVISRLTEMVIDSDD